MQYILIRHIINGKYARWVVIIQEYDLEFSTPKRKKSLAISEMITNLPSGTRDPPLHDHMTNEHLFHISSSDEWYGDILTYLCTQKFMPQLTHDDRRRIRHHATRYILIGDVLYHRDNDTLLCRCLSHEESERCVSDISGPPSSVISSLQLSIVQTVKCSPLKCEHHRPPSSLSLQQAPFANGPLISWNVN